MFLGRKTQSCENDYTIKHNLHVIPVKLPMAFSTEPEQKFHNSYGNSKDPE